MNKVIFLDPAIKEFESAIEFYNNQSEGLGFEFALELNFNRRKADDEKYHWSDEGRAPGRKPAAFA